MGGWARSSSRRRGCCARARASTTAVPCPPTAPPGAAGVSLHVGDTERFRHGVPVLLGLQPQQARTGSAHGHDLAYAEPNSRGTPAERRPPCGAPAPRPPRSGRSRPNRCTCPVVGAGAAGGEVVPRLTLPSRRVEDGGQPPGSTCLRWSPWKNRARRRTPEGNDVSRMLGRRSTRHLPQPPSQQRQEKGPPMPARQRDSHRKLHVFEKRPCPRVGQDEEGGTPSAAPGTSRRGRGRRRDAARGARRAHEPMIPAKATAAAVAREATAMVAHVARSTAHTEVRGGFVSDRERRFSRRAPAVSAVTAARTSVATRASTDQGCEDWSRRGGRRGLRARGYLRP